MEAVDEEAHTVLHWRIRRFLKLGFTLQQARTLAAGEAHWQEAERILAAGCPIPLAFDVLS